MSTSRTNPPCRHAHDHSHPCGTSTNANPTTGNSNSEEGTDPPPSSSSSHRPFRDAFATRKCGATAMAAASRRSSQWGSSFFKNNEESTTAEWMAKGFLNAFIIALSISVFLVFILGSYDYLRNVEGNKCEMTYMWEYPEYIRIKLDSELDKKYPRYGLYAYAEGRFVGPAIKRKFSGIPVLFVPGNAGSYKQVRSFASVALRKWLDSKSPFHFDFFSLDFNEELSGLYGYVLEGQREYLAGALEKVRGLYEDYHEVVLIGHSMGGIVAKSVLSSNLIITLSTPHSRPILLFDPEQDVFYYQLSRKWAKARRGDGDDDGSANITLVSVAGGDRDILVPEGFTKWSFLDVHTTTTSVPEVWASTDHLCIVWCKQFVMTVVRALFDMVEFKDSGGHYGISGDRDLRQNVLRYHLIKKTAGKSYHGAHRESELGKPPGTEWNELLVHHYCSQASRSTSYLMFPMSVIKEKVQMGKEDEYRVMVLTTNTEAKNWIFGCTSQAMGENVRYCGTVENLSQNGESIPHFRRRRKVIHLQYNEISEYSHLIVRMDPSNFKTCVDLDVYNVKETSKELLAKFETKHKMFYNLSLPFDAGIFSKVLAWSVTAKPSESETERCEGTHNSLATFKHGAFGVGRFPRNESLTVRVSDWNTTSGNVELYLEPTCKYSVTVRLSNLETAGQIFRTYFRLLPSFFGSVVLLSIYFQKDGKGWMNFHRVLLSNAYYLTVLPGFLVSFALGFVPNDWPHMLDGPEYFVLLPTFCYLVAYSMVLVVATGAWYIIIGCGNAVHAVFLRMVTTRFAKWTNLAPLPMPDQAIDFALNLTFGKFPILVSVFLVSMALGTCGALGLVAGLCFFVIKLFKMYEDILADLWRARIQSVGEGLSPLNFQFSYAMLWLLITAVNFPSLIHWVKSFSVESTPNPQWDLSMYLCLMVLPSISVLWQDYTPNFNQVLWNLHRFVFYGMGLAMVVWGTFRLYITGFILTMVLLTTATCQLISSLPFATAPAEEEERTQTRSPEVEEENTREEETEEEVDDSEASLGGMRPLYDDSQEEDKDLLEETEESGLVQESEGKSTTVEKELTAKESEDNNANASRSIRSKSKSRSINTPPLNNEKEKEGGIDLKYSQSPSPALDVENSEKEVMSQSESSSSGSSSPPPLLEEDNACR